MSKTINFEPGDIIFHEGEEGDRAYLIKTGAVKITKIGKDDSPKTINKMGKGSILGEMALIDDDTRSATAVAIDATEAIVVQRDELKSRLEKTDPFVNLLLQSLSARLREQAKLIAELQS